jgi:predicted O-methyltransferase YrrM
MQTAAHNFRALIKGIRTGRLIAMAQRYWEFARADQAVISRYGLVVRDGIFAGMQYARFPPGHHVAAKVLGVYERETAEFLRDAMRRSYDVIVNIGCAEGYYAVGLARHFANAKVFAFDIQQREQAFCARLAKLNGVSERVIVGGACDHAALESVLSGKSLIIIDCEGCEYDLLDPQIVPALQRADMIVEIHDFGGSTRIMDAVQARFSATHHIQIAQFEARDPAQIPALDAVRSPRIRRAAVLERDAPQRWCYLRAVMEA